jgi:hypothetical protein
MNTVIAKPIETIMNVKRALPAEMPRIIEYIRVNTAPSNIPSERIGSQAERTKLSTNITVASTIVMIETLRL